MTCVYVGCDLRRYRRMLCTRHLDQFHRGAPFAPLTCRHCGDDLYAKGLCRRHYQAHKLGTAPWQQPTGKTLPAEPLLRLIEHHGLPAPRTALRQAYERAQAHGVVTLEAGDALAIQVLGLHPVEVWGDAWFDGIGLEVAA